MIKFVRRLPTGKPLACYIFTRDDRVRELVTAKTTSGGLCINDAIMHLANTELPFGGVGDSGMGAYHGKRTFDALTHQKAVLRKYVAVDTFPLMRALLDARFMPYTPLKKWLNYTFAMRVISKAVNPPLNSIKKFLYQLVALYIVLRGCGYRPRLT